MCPWEGTQRKSEITQEDCILGTQRRAVRSLNATQRHVFVLVCTQGRVERGLLTSLPGKKVS